MSYRLQTAPLICLCDDVFIKVDCEQSLSFRSVFRAFLRASVELSSSSSARGGFQEQKPTTRSLL